VESDMWSLGATLYAAVEGRSPYQRETAMATLMALATEPPDPPERAGALGPVLLGLLRHDPSSRLTASEVDRRLRMVVSAVPSPRRARAAPPPPPPVVPKQRTSPESPPRPAAETPPRTLMAAGLALVALLGGGGIVASYLVQQTSVPVVSPPSASPAFVVAGFSPALCSSGSSAPAVAMPQRNATRGVSGWDLLPGWSYFSDGTGFHLPVPDDWTFQKFGSLYCFREPGGRRVLSLDTGRNASADPVTACRNEANRLVRVGALPGYSEISIEAKPLLAKAADWEYRFDDDGAELHARTRWFASNNKGYALSWATREIDWTADLAKVNMVVSLFYSDRPS
jgi:eukaryotic-like serine/threonine-protein kinase